MGTWQLLSVCLFLEQCFTDFSSYGNPPGDVQVQILLEEDLELCLSVVLGTADAIDSQTIFWVADF